MRCSFGVRNGFLLYHFVSDVEFHLGDITCPKLIKDTKYAWLKNLISLLNFLVYHVQPLSFPVIKIMWWIKITDTDNFLRLFYDRNKCCEAQFERDIKQLGIVSL